MHLPLSQIAQCPICECELVHVCRDQTFGKCVGSCRDPDTALRSVEATSESIGDLPLFAPVRLAENAGAIAEQIERLRELAKVKLSER